MTDMIAIILAAVPDVDHQQVVTDKIRMWLAVGSMGVGVLCLVSAGAAIGKARTSRVFFAFAVGFALLGVGARIFNEVKYLWGL